MNKACFLIIIPLYSLSCVAKDNDKDAIVLARYSMTDIANASLPVWGVGFANAKGSGRFGISATIDYQTFGADWGYHFFNEKNKSSRIYFDGSWGVNLMLGAAYSVTDNFYITPKIGGTYNKLYYGNVSSLENSTPKIDRGIEERYDASYGVDFMFSYSSLVMGIGISNYYHFISRETKAHLMLGYRF